MNITISGSLAFYHEMQQLKHELEVKGHQVFAPEFDNSVHQQAISLEEKASHMRKHNEQIFWADCLLIYNATKREIPGYIGPNTLIEMGIAFYLQKPTYLMYEIPNISYKEEIEAMQPILLNNDLTRINNL